jgi:hypothetical protein
MKVRSDKGKGRPRVKFQTPYRVSGMCKACTPGKPSGQHRLCFNVNCICPHHPNWTALYAREYGLRTVPKPGDPDFTGVVTA